MSNIEELNVPFDPFADAEEDKTQKVDRSIHLRIQQRGGRKSVTTLQGLPEELNLKKILAYLKREFACSGKVNEEENAMLFAGDQRQKLAEFLVKEKIAKKEDIKIHGF